MINLNASAIILLIILGGIPLIGLVFARVVWRNQLTASELIANCILSVLIVAGAYFTGHYQVYDDREISNGQVLSKTRSNIQCIHTHNCRCRQECDDKTGNQTGKRNCRQVCEICRAHPHDFDWVLNTSIGNISIPADRFMMPKGDPTNPRFIDEKQTGGFTPPTLYERAQIGDPVTQRNPVTYYRKMVPDSLWEASRGAYAFSHLSNLLPTYPDTVEQLFHLNRVIEVGPTLIENPAVWNDTLAHSLRDIGLTKQVNVIVVLANLQDENYAYALQHYWKSGKRNDVVVVLGINTYPKLQWVRVFTGAPQEGLTNRFGETLAQQLLPLPVEPTAIIQTIHEAIAQHYQRPTPQNHAELQGAIEPPVWALVILIGFGVMLSLSLSFLLSRRSLAQLTPQEHEFYTYYDGGGQNEYLER
jgi:hypothetical protein